MIARPDNRTGLPIGPHRRALQRIAVTAGRRLWQRSIPQSVGPDTLEVALAVTQLGADDLSAAFAQSLDKGGEDR
jgi:hypothetical protein